MFQNIKGFHWDNENVSHICRHNVEPDEIEEAFFYDRGIKVFEDYLHSDDTEERFFALAKVPSSRRLLKFVFCFEEEYLRVITAYQCTHDKKLIWIYTE